MYRYTILYNANRDASPSRRKTLRQLREEVRKWEETTAEDKRKKSKAADIDAVAYQVRFVMIELPWHSRGDNLALSIAKAQGHVCQAHRSCETNREECGSVSECGRISTCRRYPDGREYRIATKWSLIDTHAFYS